RGDPRLARPRRDDPSRRPCLALRHLAAADCNKRNATAMHIETDATQHLQRAAKDARAASHVLARASDAERNTALLAMATALRTQSAAILAANAGDLDACTGTAAFRDRLALTKARVEAMAKGLDDIARLPDPLERTLADWTRPNGLRIQR